MFEDFRADLARARTENFIKKTWFHQNIWILMQPKTQVVGAYRIYRWARKLRNPFLRAVMKIFAWFISRWMEFLTGVFIAPTAEIGPGFVVHQVYGVLIGGTRIGKNCTVASGTKISYMVRQIGDDVSIGMGAVLVEDITIGNNVRVAPNSLVFTDVPDNTTVIGNPARIRLRRAPLRPAGAPLATSPVGTVDGAGTRSAAR
jgi:serine O-acetyltransferase